MKNKRIVPSLICMDLCNMEQETKELERLGCDMLHIDIIDGIFSPDMPLGIGSIKRLRELSGMMFDVHLMAVNNAPYVEQLIACGVDRLCFHTEFESRPSILLRKIKAQGVKTGIAISPETKISSVEYLLPLCDFVLLMRIDAGYAHLPGQIVYPQIEEKITELLEYIKKYNLSLEIEVDGRVGFEETEKLLGMGVDTFVSGTKGVFHPQHTRMENWDKLQRIIRRTENV